MSLGCSHYKRKVKLVAPCCNKVYTCRVCHDEKEDHTLNTQSIVRLICMMCTYEQGIQNMCSVCETQFGNYYCYKCRLFDDEDKQQFHCDYCGICRIGGRQNFYHCHTCKICLNKLLYGRHRCLEGGSIDKCPVCLEDLHTSRKPLSVPICGHFIHEECYNDLSKNNISVCPKCQEKFQLLHT